MNNNIALAFALAAALTGAAGANAFARSRHEGRELAWPRGKVLFVNVSALANDDEKRAFARAAHAWNETGCASLAAVDGPAGDIEVLRGLVADAVNAADTETDDDRGRLLHARITLDANRALASPADASALGKDDIDLESLALHELGHALGLAHPVAIVRDPTAIMNAGVKPGVARRVLGADDVAGVCAIYDSRG